MFQLLVLAILGNIITQKKYMVLKHAITNIKW